MLNFDERYSKEFYTILTKIEGLRDHVNTIIVTEKETYAIITLYSPQWEIHILKKFLTKKGSVFEESESYLEKLMVKRLSYDKKLSRLEWREPIINDLSS